MAAIAGLRKRACDSIQKEYRPLNKSTKNPAHPLLRDLHVSHCVAKALHFKPNVFVLARPRSCNYVNCMQFPARLKPCLRENVYIVHCASLGPTCDLLPPPIASATPLRGLRKPASFLSCFAFSVSCEKEHTRRAGKRASAP